MDYWYKRVLDIVISALSLLLLLPVLFVVALSVILDSRGPVFLTHPRVGGTRRKSAGDHEEWQITAFKLYRFRTVYHGGDQPRVGGLGLAPVTGKTDLAYTDRHNLGLARDSCRTTRVGALLRTTGLDRLPELWNVLIGDMSMVGPRPVADDVVPRYRTERSLRLAAKAGITGLWNVGGQGRVSPEEIDQMDLEYARRQSVWLDLKILLLTVPVIVAGAEGRSHR